MMTATCCGNDDRASALKWEVAEIILFVRRLREFSEMKNKTSGKLPVDKCINPDTFPCG